MGKDAQARPLWEGPSLTKTDSWQSSLEGGNSLLLGTEKEVAW